MFVLRVDMDMAKNIQCARQYGDVECYSLHTTVCQFRVELIEVSLRGCTVTV
jgi:hypothetical protein